MLLLCRSVRYSPFEDMEYNRSLLLTLATLVYDSIAFDTSVIPFHGAALAYGGLLQLWQLFPQLQRPLSFCGEFTCLSL